MNTKTKKEELEKEYSKNQFSIQSLAARQEQIKGQYQLLEEMEKEVSIKEKKNA
jgi:hypothetical protein